ncbi:hypothetical protein FH972_020423 [Carpinus fangiana]|uniref:NB-ARC domain-containing protein n=1 Tax=Carpinus fangiana TaxID=176857 RepID=A0A5N6RWM9_9ROSI|nr:hypothetical protein FH972_020423 [Carpinus fangiana]
MSKEATEKLKDIQGLLKDGRSHSNVVAVNHGMPRAVERIPRPTIQDQITPSKTLAEIMALLSDDGVQRIGTWGMGGVGKTTLVRSLNNKLKSFPSVQPFGIVIWVTISQNFDMKKVQKQIAERLNLASIVGESMERLINRLYEKLDKVENFLLILDDVFEKIDLNYLGVPRPEDHKGSKIILTTRFLDVCRHMMTNRQVKVAVLNDDESWQLLSKTAGHVASLEHISPFAKAIARECCGLPLALVTMGAAMREKTKDFSIEISELAKCWLAEGLLDDRENYEDSFNRVINLIENVKDSCLLEDSAHEDTVKMHDVVRDVAIWIVSSFEDGCKSLVCSGIGLSEMSVVELLNSLKRIPFMNNMIIRLPDCVVQCSKASMLLLQGNLPLDRVLEKFLQGFEALRVLNMGGTNIHSLHLSVLQLGELRALLLGGCCNLKELPPLEGLSRLQVLDLFATDIRELPRGMENLSNLKQLNLSQNIHLTTIQAGIIYRLS